MRQLQGMDSSFVALEQRNAPMHIGSILIYDPATAPGGFVRFKDILAFFETRMPLSRTMRQRLVKVPFDLDYPYWIEDPDFDLEYHVRHLALPKPGDWRQLCIQAARIFARPLDLTRPPWEFAVIEGLDNVEGVPKGSFAMVTKVHHAAIDGMSGIDLMEALHTLDPAAPPPDAASYAVTVIAPGADAVSVGFVDGAILPKLTVFASIDTAPVAIVVHVAGPEITREPVPLVTVSKASDAPTAITVAVLVADVASDVRAAGSTAQTPTAAAVPADGLTR